ncbi:exodeoxyribonuclease V subunit gamma [Halomonas sp. HL-93]|uniref:exodeoxyribonuclease V subunit gamma n=1 Tax=Halomonas sp. HL-93 TaxID=1666906 RepID=UPI0006DAFE96|nr:exodeoxyribonuclease V subunit gamma [Halomonas sp. HL-93]KPQ30823.1 MAG: exodeoxyribonuclease V gamma subunit RecC [Halomonas sp. HL-93]SBR50451.1 DNA helicase/exodeoxyribonuclease V, gamma subunit [Halomonas sp. HL-93]
MPANSLLSPTSLTPGFMVVHGNRLEDLRGLAVEWMRLHPLGPLENETILVQSNGIGQWLKLALAEDPDNGGAGIAAALDVMLPARFLWQAYRTVLTHVSHNEDAVPETSPFDKSRLVWRLLRLLPTLAGQEVFAPLAQFLEIDRDQRKHYQLAERLADLFDQYQVYRADWLDAWANGEDVLITARGEARPLEDHQRWQPALWRILRDDVAATQGDAGLDSSRAQVHRRFLKATEKLEGQACPPGLPRRLIIFGISSLPQQTLEALAALSRCCQVVLCVHNPCQYYWADIIEHKDLLRASRYRQRRKTGMPEALDVLGTGDADDALHLHAQPLLAAWGKQGRDYLRLLDEHDDTGDYQTLFEQQALRIDMFEPFSGERGCLLSQLQDDIRELRPVAETQTYWPALDPADDSLVFHIAHGPQREVEILHDQLLAAFSDDPELRPRDIIVMVPDIDRYAPHIDAVFGQLQSDDPRFIPYTLSDQASRHRLPMMIALEKLLRLPELRLSVSDLLDLLDVPALRQRFGLEERDLPVLERWMEGAGIRWGLNAKQRQTLELPGGLSQNTWAFGLRRLLLGYTVGDGDAWQGIEPFDDIGGLEAGLAGPLATLLEKLEATWETFRQPTDAASWVERLRTLLETFFLTDDAQESVMLTKLENGLQQILESSREAQLADPLPLSMVREHWLAQIDEHSLSQRFLAGAVNFATLMPMRAIPFKRVCLLGMNDGEYPRSQPPLDFDLMGSDYRPGDRSRREDDRYLFLEALLSARDQLYISWVGRSQIDNTTLPPSVLVGQLRDHLAAGWHFEHDAPLLDTLTTEHPLQPFSRRYFEDSTESAQLFTYIHEWRGVHEWRDDQAPRAPRSQLEKLPPPENAPASLSLGQLGGFLREPVRTFFNTRLGVYFEQEAIAELDAEPFALDGLQNWQLQDRLIAAQRHAVDNGEPRLEALDAQLERFQRQGVLAMGAFGERMRESLAEPMDDLFSAYEDALAQWPIVLPAPEPVYVESADGIVLEDWLNELRQNEAGDRCRLLLLSSSLISQGSGRGQYRWTHLLRPWVAHLAGNLNGPMTTQLLSKAGNITLAPIAADTARAHLDTQMTVWQAGLQAPLPLAPQAAFAWLTKLGTPEIAEEKGRESDAYAAAEGAYDGGRFQTGEVAQSAYLAHQWPRFERLFNDHREQAHSFAALTEALYAPLFNAVKNPAGKDQERSGDSKKKGAAQ